MDDQTSNQVPEQVTATQVIDTESAIKERMDRIEKTKEELRPQKEMLEAMLQGNSKYMELVEIAKRANKEKLNLKKQILNNPEAHAIDEKIKSLKEELKELNEGLSYYLREFQRITGANEFEGADGELRQIVYTAKLVRARDAK